MIEEAHAISQMHQKSLLTLEFPKIVERLAYEAAFSASKELARALLPSADGREVRRRLALTTEARRLMDLRPDVGVRGARDVRPHAAAAERGVVLSPAELREVLATLRASGYLGRAIARLDASFPLLKVLGEDLPARPTLEGHIEESIGEEGEVLDSASPDLRRLRAEIRAAQQRLQERLGTLVNEFRNALQEPIITMRSDRYVLPVRAEAKGQVRGIVHDTSGSGATVFIEPLVVVEMNNRLRELQLAERAEVERILAALSDEVGTDAAYVRLAVELLAEIDVQLAKARYAGLIRAVEPRVDTEGRLDLREARHPLLTGTVVPIDFRLGDEFNMVVITGPNTGGKTVALKTVGLLSLMAQAGLHIPAREDSVVPIYSAVYADIGDEQSIEQSLSTFSSHLSRIVEILREAAPGALVLLDELGAGTDPSEGSALARSILADLLARGIATVGTTHYSELKAFAHEQPGVANASVEFDVETLSPTYHLTIGLPGRSNALAIAARLGLPENIIAGAREFQGTTGAQMEALLQDLHADRKAAADLRYALSMERAEAEHLRRELEREKAALQERRAEILNEARSQARRELQELQAELARLRGESRHRSITEEQLSGLRGRARGLEERTAPLPGARRTSRRSSEPAAEVLQGPLEMGDTVRVASMNAQGELLTLPDSRGEVEVQLGALKLRVPATDVERLSKRKARGEGVGIVTLPPAREGEPPTPLQLDLRGQRVDDVLPEVDKYLNDAYLTGLPFVRLLHGKGTGALRQAIREQLARHPLVKSFEAAPQKEGGEGVTVVALQR
ncbi:MAG TPA: endonuclease MutS2 [Ktedonobacterales bacterium]|nr:endonuclease MutS2 [Ktedonobacterales bacterium]